MWEVLLGGALTLTGGVLGQWWQSRREDKRWNRESNHEQKREALMKLLLLAETFQRQIFDEESSEETPAPGTRLRDDPDAAKPLWDALSLVEVYGDEKTHQVAKALVEITDRWVYAADDVDLLTPAAEARRRYRDRVRLELGIEPIKH